MFGIAQKLLGSVNDRKIRPYRSIVQRINALEPVTEALSDEALKQRTRDFRQQVANGAKLDDILPEAFATVREAAKRTRAPSPRCAPAKARRWWLRPPYT
jgi:preprotein translocase subunit SecA